MTEFAIRRIDNGEEYIIFGYDLNDAFRRHPSLNPNEWECYYYEYID